MRNCAKIMLILPLMLGLGLGVYAQSTTDQLIQERRAFFKENASALKAIRGAIADGDFALIAEQAQKVADWSGQMTDYFPPESATGDTRADPEIWNNFAEFTGYAKDAEAAALNLVALANMGDAAALPAGLQALGATCGACHDRFPHHR